MTLGEKQELFSDLYSKWVRWCIDVKGWKIRPGESRILQVGPDGKGRRAQVIAKGKAGAIVRVRDLVHDADSLHYKGLAADPQLFVHGEWIDNTDSPYWQEAGQKWESMHDECRWGGRWGDGNHLSIEHEGKK